MKKQGIIFVLLVIILISFLTFRQKSSQISTEIKTPIETLQQQETTNTESTTQNISSSSSSNLKDKIWNTVLAYSEAAKSHNIEQISLLAHRLSATCTEAKTDKTKEQACFKNLDNAHGLLSSLNKNSFTTLLSDSKQAILMTTPEIKEDSTQKTTSRTLFYFTIENGLPKILGIDPYRSHSVKKEGKTAEEVEALLKEKILDTDNDGLEDIIESCSIKQLNCMQTDPKQKDTNKDGYWDSINPLL